MISGMVTKGRLANSILEGRYIIDLLAMLPGDERPSDRCDLVKCTNMNVELSQSSHRIWSGAYDEKSRQRYKLPDWVTTIKQQVYTTFSVLKSTPGVRSIRRFGDQNHLVGRFGHRKGIQPER